MNIKLKIILTLLFSINVRLYSSLVLYEKKSLIKFVHPITALVLYEKKSLIKVINEILIEKVSKKDIDRKGIEIIMQNNALYKLLNNDYFVGFARRYIRITQCGLIGTYGFLKDIPQDDKEQLEWLGLRMKYIAGSDFITDSFIAAGDSGLYTNESLMTLHDLLIMQDSIKIDHLTGFVIFMYASKIMLEHSNFLLFKKKLLRLYNKMIAIEEKDYLKNIFEDEYFSQYSKKYLKILFFIGLYWLGKNITDQFKDERIKVEELKKIIQEVVQTIELHYDNICEELCKKKYGEELNKDDALIKKMLEDNSFQKTIKNIIAFGGLFARIYPYQGVHQFPQLVRRKNSVLLVGGKKSVMQKSQNPILFLQKLIGGQSINPMMTYYSKTLNRKNNIFLENKERLFCTADIRSEFL